MEKWRDRAPLEMVAVAMFRRFLLRGAHGNSSGLNDQIVMEL